MNEDLLPDYSDVPPPREEKPPPDMPTAEHTIGSSTLYRLCSEVIALREKNERTHRLFEQKLKEARDGMASSFNSFAADTQRAYQQLRQEIQGEKRVAVALLNELMEIASDLQHIVGARPPAEDAEANARWGDAVEVQSRKVQAALQRHGIYPYDAVLASPYDPKLHERVGSRRVEGMDALRVAEQVERGYASQQPGFVLRRPKVIVSE